MSCLNHVRPLPFSESPSGFGATRASGVDGLVGAAVSLVVDPAGAAGAVEAGVGASGVAAASAATAVGDVDAVVACIVVAVFSRARSPLERSGVPGDEITPMIFAIMPAA